MMEFLESLVPEIDPASYSPRSLHRLFVYGTLKQGFRNHARLGRRSRFLGTAMTTPLFDLKTKGFADCLAPVALRGGSFRITGELYEVSGDILEQVDACEGHPFVYQRSPVRLLGQNQSALFYLFQGARKDLDSAGIVQDGMDLTFVG